MGRALRLAVMGVPVGMPVGGGGAQTYAQYRASLIASGELVLAYPLTEKSGTTVANLGTGGAACNGTAEGGVTLGQTGQLGANEAYLFDAEGEKVSVPNVAAWANLTTWEWCFLVKPTAANPDGSRILDVSSHYRFIVKSDLTFNVYAPAATDAHSESTTTVTPNVWQMISITYDHAGDRKLHIYINGTEVSYSTQTASVGDYGVSVLPLCLGNLAGGAREFIGLFDEILYFNTVDDTRRQTLLDFFFPSGVIGTPLLSASFDVADTPLAHEQALGAAQGVYHGSLTLSDVNTKGASISGHELRLPED